MSGSALAPTDGASGRGEVYISVDIEASGPVPPDFSLLSIGACVVGAPEVNYYVELQPLSDRAVPEALKVTGLSLEHLAAHGTPPEAAMKAFRDWVVATTAGRRAVFVGFNASFDWAFVNWYFLHFLGENPFGIGALDIKAYFMGLEGSSWRDTSSSRLPVRFQPSQRQTHNALDDARSQAEIFHKLLTDRRHPSAR